MCFVLKQAGVQPTGALTSVAPPVPTIVMFRTLLVYLHKRDRMHCLSLSLCLCLSPLATTGMRNGGSSEAGSSSAPSMPGGGSFNLTLGLLYYFYCTSPTLLPARLHVMVCHSELCLGVSVCANVAAYAFCWLSVSHFLPRCGLLISALL